METGHRHLPRRDPLGLVCRQVNEIASYPLICRFSSVAESFPLEVQEAEENFDLALIAALEIDVVPHLGDSRVPDYIITQLARVLLQGSQLRDEDDYQLPSPRSLPDGSTRSSQDFDKVERFGDHSLPMGTTDVGRFLPRERFSYWCFDLLFLICSDTAQGKAQDTRGFHSD